MFEVGWSEYLLIFGLALVVLGPEKLPKLAASIGRWVGRARVMARQFRDQLETETESIRSSVKDVHEDIESAASEVQSSFSEVQQGLQTIHTPTPEHAPIGEPPPAGEAPVSELPPAATPAPPAAPQGQDERR
jgi:sec-independent protein translocase protein TatB